MRGDGWELEWRYTTRTTPVSSLQVDRFHPGTQKSGSAAGLEDWPAKMSGNVQWSLNTYHLSCSKASFNLKGLKRVAKPFLFQLFRVHKNIYLFISNPKWTQHQHHLPIKDFQSCVIAANRSCSVRARVLSWYCSQVTWENQRVTWSGSDLTNMGPIKLSQAFGFGKKHKPIKCSSNFQDCVGFCGCSWKLTGHILQMSSCPRYGVMMDTLYSKIRYVINSNLICV